MKVLLQGGGSGSRLAKKLILEGHEVYGTIHDSPSQVEGMQIINADLTNDEFEIPDVKFDVVFHLAAATPLVKDKKKQKRINHDGTVNLFKKIKDKTEFIIYASGLGVFGIQMVQLMNKVNQTGYRFCKNKIRCTKFLEDL